MNRRDFIKATVGATTAFTAVRLIAGEWDERAALGGAPQKTGATFRGDELKTEDEYKPGDKVPVSGVYDVTHDRLDGDPHALPHQVTARAGKKFPPCRACGDGVRFRLHQVAEPVEAHHLFNS